MFALIGAIIVGLIAGLIAKLLVPGRDPGGIFLTIILGIAGALLATYLGRAVGLYHHDQKAGLIGAIVGSIIILLLHRLYLRSRTP